MKITTALAIFLKLFLVTDAHSLYSDAIKRVICYYDHGSDHLNGTSVSFYESDISICSHLIVNETFFMNVHRDSIVGRREKSREKGIFQRIQTLKEDNPDMKLILQTDRNFLYQIAHYPIYYRIGLQYMEEKCIHMKKLGFDGIHIDWSEKYPPFQDDMITWCVAVNLFQYYDLTISIFIEQRGFDNMTFSDHEDMKKFEEAVGCSEFLQIFHSWSSLPGTVFRKSSFYETKLLVSKIINAEIPPNKIVITIPIVGIYLKYPHNTFGENNNSTRLVQTEVVTPAYATPGKVAELLKNSSLGWTIRRNKATREPYAYTNTGDWLSFEDKTSMECKAKYVFDKGLGGIFIESMIFEDSEGIGGEGKLPLTRAVYNFFKGVQSEI